MKAAVKLAFVFVIGLFLRPMECEVLGNSTHAQNEMLRVIYEVDEEEFPVMSSVLKDFRDEVENITMVDGTTRSGRCGAGRSDPRIVGGSHVPRDADYPWMVHIKGMPGNLVCGGTLISDQWVLTAAHCLKVRRIYVVIGTRSLSSFSKERVDLKAIEWHSHPHYAPFKNDIGVVRIPSLTRIKPNYRTICLPFGASIADENVPAVAAGWGWTSENGPLSDTLKYVSTYTLDRETCKTMSNGMLVEPTDSVLCIDPKGGAQTVCRGDSGGPLFKRVGGGYYQIGIVSFGTRRCQSGVPPRFTRIQKYYSFLCGKCGICN